MVSQIMNARTTYFLKSIDSLITISLNFVNFRIRSVAYNKRESLAWIIAYLPIFVRIIKSFIVVNILGPLAFGPRSIEPAALLLLI